MDNLWTPWRYHYISSADKIEGCVFCRILESGEEKDSENLVICRRDHSFVILNRYPYTSGHLMVVARRHIKNLSDARSEELSEIMNLASRAEACLTEVYKPEGFNVGFNIGKCAGAGVDSHLHLHVIPRWMGDSNFVATAGQTRVIPELLETTYSKVRKAFLKI